MPLSGRAYQNLLIALRQMHAQQDLDSLLQLLAGQAADFTSAQRASIFLLEPSSNQLWSRVAIGTKGVLRFSADKGIAGAALRASHPLIVNDPYSDKRFLRSIDQQTGFETSSILAIAIRDRQETPIGVFEVLNKRRGRFNRNDVEILKIFAAHAADALQSIQSADNLRRERDSLAQQNLDLRRRLPSHAIIGASPPIQSVLQLIHQIRDTNVEVLITGQSGTGKELVARAIHESSSRASQPFVALNCAALPDTLVESELFGVERGVATGVDRRPGQFERASGGTLFLDEAGDLSLAAQAKILRVLQEKTVERLGGRKPIPVDVRLIAATNKDLENAIAAGLFREDLFYRLNVIRIQMPSLDRIREDIPVLSSHFLDEACREMERAPMRFSPAALHRLTRAPWPGNARQLRNEIRRAVATVRGPVISERDLTPAGGDTQSQATAATLPKAVAELEQRMIGDALRATGGNQLQAAKALGISRQGLINKMKRYGIDAV
jgi:Nif-specific regulatory protein